MRGVIEVINNSATEMDDGGGGEHREGLNAFDANTLEASVKH